MSQSNVIQNDSIQNDSIQNDSIQNDSICVVFVCNNSYYTRFQWLCNTTPSIFYCLLSTINCILCVSKLVAIGNFVFSLLFIRFSISSLVIFFALYTLNI